jgi:hypothetical protein
MASSPISSGSRNTLARRKSRRHALFSALTVSWFQALVIRDPKTWSSSAIKTHGSRRRSSKITVSSALGSSSCLTTSMPPWAGSALGDVTLTCMRRSVVAWTKSRVATAVTDFHSAIAQRRYRWVERADRSKRGETKWFRTAEEVETNRCDSGHDRNPCIIRCRFSDGTMGILRSIVQPFVLAMLDPRQERALGGGVRVEFVGYGLPLAGILASARAVSAIAAQPSRSGEFARCRRAHILPDRERATDSVFHR